MLGLGGLALVVAALAAGCADDGGEPDGTTGQAVTGAPGASAAAASVDAYLHNRLDPASVISSLRTRDGRRIDCVDIDQQPALRTPQLRGHKRATPPSVLGAGAPGAPGAALAGPVAPEPLFELGSQTRALCPPGTVPIPEVTRADLGRFASLDEFFAKGGGATTLPTGAAGPGGDALAPPHAGPTAQHQYAHAFRSVTNWGAQTGISIPSQATELSSEFSLGQIWVVAGSGAGLQTLEAGIQHYRDLYGDSSPHLFIYSTRGNYAPGTGCYNNTCADFVQVSSTWFPAAAVGPVSVAGGTQYLLNVQWTKAGDTGDWWLGVQGEWVGYYPRSLYTAAINRAAQIDYGGEIVDNRNGGRHTMTDMGSGAFASAGWTFAAFMQALRYYDSNPSANNVTWVETTGLASSESDAACYSIALVSTSDPVWHNYFWYGGPGYANPACL